jgi:Rieske Fe-S protein
VGYQPDLGCIRCACHEGRFDLDGRVLSGPPPAPLRTLYHAWRGDKLVLALEEKNLAQAP